MWTGKIFYITKTIKHHQAQKQHSNSLYNHLRYTHIHENVGYPSQFMIKSNFSLILYFLGRKIKILNFTLDPFNFPEKNIHIYVYIYIHIYIVWVNHNKAINRNDQEFSLI